MLKLHRLELFGFKSFVDDSVLEFSGGITAVVGPNGCGKSNLCDAVTWVLGERSAKSLRGDTMEDVIFNGSGSRKPVGLAEATLTLLTDPDFPGSQDGRLTVGRRVDRAGEGEYFINGRRVRLKDIRDLLMDTGLGLRAYSVIEQGKVGMILSGKPQERRRLLEEAAGITRYKERKRVAEVKLESALTNLHRLDDILAELERNLRSLKRQAGAARRYEERRQEMRELLARVLAGRWSRQAQRLAQLQRRVEGLQAEEASSSAALHRAEAELAEAREELERLTRTLSERHQRQAELAARIEGRQEFLKSSRARLEELTERIAGGEALCERRRTEIADRQTALREVEATCLQLAEEHRLAAADVDLDAGELESAESELAQSERTLELTRAELLTSLGRLNDLRNRRHREQTECEKGEFRRRRLDEELTGREGHVEQAAGELSAAEAALESLAGRCTAAEDELSRAERTAAETATAREDVAQSLVGRRQDLARMEQRQEVLRELSQAHADRREGLRRALQAAGLPEPRFLAEGLEAPRGWERVLDEYLGALADAVVVPADRDALELAAATESGVALIERVGLPAPSTGLPEPDETLGSLAEELGIPTEVASALSPAYLVDDAATARRLAHAYPGVAFLSRDLVARGGVLQRPSDSSQPGQLARKQELDQLERERERLQADAERLEAEATRLEKALQEATAAREAAADTLSGLQRERAVAEARRDDARAHRHRLELERDTLATERDEIVRELARILGTAERLTAELEAAEREHHDRESAFDRLQQETQAARERRAALRTEGTGHRGKLELLTERLTAQRRTEERLRDEIRDAEQHVAAWRDEAEQLAARRRELGEAMAAAEQELQETLETRAGAEEQVMAAQEVLDEQRRRVRELEAQVEAARGTREEIREALSEARVEHAGCRQESDNLRGAFRDQLGEEPPDETGEPPAELAELEIDLQRLKERLEGMGPVNLLAAEEYREQEERHGFLSTQRDDVAQSIERLRRTIREINQTSSQRFRDTFEEVNRHFGVTFVELFQGGEAEMRLLDEEDLLESGIEIVARPPGKRAQNIMLLSGGEKALTAIALLFALFRTKPSPFCILDEVDAPLDDLNTLRFAEMLKRLAGETQFVVITHNKLTMEAASRLYGVTMQERGVSSLVAVELDEVQPPEEASAREAAASA
ncbi:MAG: chromosome segregation protein SMC [Thermoanaerobaculia bacterium]